ncbi:hypothetical protein Vi05172_g2379 [Venturia inaequalis]|nr:hypothetical protein Vi05172_g2379 [Venturia inaequalis]
MDHGPYLDRSARNSESTGRQIVFSANPFFLSPVNTIFYEVPQNAL